MNNRASTRHSWYPVVKEWVTPLGLPEPSSMETVPVEGVVSHAERPHVVQVHFCERQEKAGSQTESILVVADWCVVSF